tara:strand:- start:1175 stop:2218 length:1044 start_codon:yes stop_codon:yes gene_type:complete
MDYKKSGVDIKAGREFVSQIKAAVEETHSKNVINSIGGFGGLFRFPIDQFKKPILVSGTDGVGTKLELAQKKNYHFEVGIDLVAMCVNDIITTGAVPLFFLDYIATGKLDKNQLQLVIKGIASSCKDNNCALIGGETAEMPGFYSSNKYDLAGFCVGVVEEDKLIDGRNIKENDLIIAIESNGIHSNGYSLVRNVISNVENIDKKFKKISNLNFYDELLKPTRIYCNLINQILSEDIEIKGMSHITGGGIPENLPRSIPSNLIPNIDLDSWKIPLIFQFLKDYGQIPEKDLWNTFNLGVGFCLIIDKKYKNKVLQICNSQGVSSWQLGKILKKENSDNNFFLENISI